MTSIERNRAANYFRSKMEFSLGPAELNHLIHDRENVVILDVRAEEDYRKGHIPGAVNVPKDRWDTFTGLNVTQRHVVYCYTQQCHLATNACLTLATKGFHAMELEGGMEAWKQFGYRVEGGEATIRKAA